MPAFAEMVTFDSVTFETGASGRPQIVPAVGQLVAVTLRMVIFLLMGVRSVVADQDHCIAGQM